MSSADHAQDLHNIISQLPSGNLRIIHNYDYNTVLGLTYAAMYPDGFDRMINDGTFDAVKVWKSGDNDPVSVQDANKAVEAYFDSCAASQPCSIDGLATPDPNNFPIGNCAGCYFWNSTASAIKVRYYLSLLVYCRPSASHHTDHAARFVLKLSKLNTTSHHLSPPSRAPFAVTARPLGML
jgi:hypothetical protein